ncbi:phosphatidylserine decarboxylase Psd1 [Schizosaccharomyces japonicus yFS275]|uniref:Phosphatidylserine decarboxylase proenzyme 1, mitochondrial n=1 Tax=Schizosaccharomyces japonicus (strain yFS275 / FY16936) TaxID=402676 RepID=B6K4G4_SCHJY|nr:phosphatidylserine decarboxylase Psd1 [Schizosaccharomyces japonicus yFS275]EEB08371.1 phosphatidylserine decarboxylase Psd1 [Schizosaccharomyces japonicus yFS275]
MLLTKRTRWLTKAVLRRGYSTRVNNPKPRSTRWPVGAGVLGLGFATCFWLFHERRDVETKKGVKIEGPWQVYVLSTLPLRTLSRVWGALNSVHLPAWIRVPWFRLYATIFGCNLDEAACKDLREYRNLSEFFGRALKPGARQVDEDAIMVSPSDGKVLSFGVLEGDRMEQVKGLTYSLNALLGDDMHAKMAEEHSDHMSALRHEKFAVVNGIDYSLQDIFGHDHGEPEREVKTVPDASADHRDLFESSRVAVKAAPQFTSHKDDCLYYAVVYLSPGDYHRFHSPTDWVVERRRHFSGELFSVSPYMAKRLCNLFVLNERVALLGRYKYGFMSMVPVGATNVGSIVINFDKQLRTNRFSKLGPPGTFEEATYESSSPTLDGMPFTKGEEMGRFELGSTIILVFEAPKNFEFNLNVGQRVLMGQSLGSLRPHSPS